MARSIFKDIVARPGGEAEEERLRRASPFAAAAAAATTDPPAEPFAEATPDLAAAAVEREPAPDAPDATRTPTRRRRTERAATRGRRSTPEGETAVGRFAGKGPRRTIGAHLPVSLDKRLTRYERQRRREGAPTSRIALVEQAIQELPADLNQLAALLEQHAHLLDLDEATRLFTARVAVATAERLDELVDACYLEADLPKVTKRALVVAALARLLDDASIPA